MINLFMSTLRENQRNERQKNVDYGFGTIALCINSDNTFNMKKRKKPKTEAQKAVELAQSREREMSKLYRAMGV